jgi:hypothetical protein
MDDNVVEKWMNVLWSRSPLEDHPQAESLDGEQLYAEWVRWWRMQVQVQD